MISPLLLYTLLLSFLKEQNVASPVDNLSNLKQECSSIIRDVVFILDATDTISKADFQLAQKFTKEMIKFIKAANNQNKIAFIVFGNSADIAFDFNESDSIDDMIKVVEAIKNENVHTAIGRALNLTLTELLPTMRTTADKLIILLTDGANTKYPAPFTYAEKLKSECVKILTIGIGSDINREELTRIATSGLSITFEKYHELVYQKNEIIFYICPDANVSTANYDSLKECCFPNRWGARLVNETSDKGSLESNEVFYDYSQRILLTHDIGSKLYIFYNDTIKIFLYYDDHNKYVCSTPDGELNDERFVGTEQCIGVNSGYKEIKRTEEFVELKKTYIDRDFGAMQLKYKFKPNNCKFVSHQKEYGKKNMVKNILDGDYLDSANFKNLQNEMQKHC